MKLLLRAVVLLAVLALMGWAAYKPALHYWKERNRVQYRTAEVVRGDIVMVVNSSGTVKPVLSVQIGSFVSGPIESLYVDFNDEVKEGDLLAKIDPRIYEAAVARDRALLASREAELLRVQAELQRAINDERRANTLREQNPEFIAESEMDQYKFNRMALEAQLAVAKTAIQQAQASLESSEANLAYTEIRSPVDGIVIDRKIDPGQTLAAQFQTPQLFVVAPDMRKEMHVFASVDEADIGLVRQAQQAGRPVHFTVDAYPSELFEGRIAQIRMSSTATQNVVTYPVVIAAPNPDLKLLPGMTANISFQIDERRDVLKIPNSALWFYPQNANQVRPEDRDLLEGTDGGSGDDDAMDDDVLLPAVERVAAAAGRERRHVWVLEGDYLKAIEVITGLSDHRYTELVSGAIQLGQKLVTGIASR